MTDGAERERPRILVVDDERFYLNLLSDTLSADYRVSLAKSGEQALRRVMGAGRPDLILLDVVMPGLDGYETCRRLKANVLSRGIPVVFLTAKRDEHDELKGFELGAVDYITKPISIPILKTRVRNQIALAEQRFALEMLVEERTREVDRTKDAVVYSMGAMAEARDEETGNHIVRTREYVRLLVAQLGEHPDYRGMLDPYTAGIIYRAAPLHDVGKIGVPDAVLRKRGALDEEERREMNRHPRYGRDAILRAEAEVGSTPFIQVAKEIAYCHHEKWDGSGYPEGLRGEGIPLSARLMAVADVYDALLTKRYYKEAMPHDKARKIIVEGAGSHFDPVVVEAFAAVEDQFRAVSERYKDG